MIKKTLPHGKLTEHLTKVILRIIHRLRAKVTPHILKQVTRSTKHYIYIKKGIRDYQRRQQSTFLSGKNYRKVLTEAAGPILVVAHTGVLGETPGQFTPRKK